MNQIVPTEERTSAQSVAITAGARGTSIAPQNLGEVVRFAEVMSRADIALPKHLRGNPGACMAVALQALEWQMSPFAVASKSYAVNGMIAYEAQLIAAVVNTRSGIKGRLKYEFIGEGNDLYCRVTGILDGEECSYESPPFAAITPKNSPLWKTDPRQQIGYFAARSWARRHCPEVLLGVYDREEAEHFGPDNAKDVTPSVMARLRDAQNRPQEPATGALGFSPSHVASETAALSGEAPAAQETEPEPSTAAPLVDEGSGGESPTPDPDPAAAPPSAEPAKADPPADDGMPIADAAWLLSAARQLWAGTGKGEQELVSIIAADLKKNTPATIGKAARERAQAVVRRCKTVCFGEVEPAEALEIVAGIVGVEPKEIAAP